VKQILSKWAAIMDQFESWSGVRLPTPGKDTGAYILVTMDAGAKARIIGTLSQERGEFVFRYDSGYAADPTAEPIPAFPDRESEYRSKDLWPFFAVRIPPVNRQDVSAALEHRGIRPDQTLEILGALASRTISNPYKLELRHAS